MTLNTMIQHEEKRDEEFEALDSKVVNLQQDLLTDVANLNTINLQQFNSLLANENMLNRDALLRSANSLISNVKMLKKRKIVPSDIAEQLIDVLQLVKKEIAKHDVDISFPALYPAQVIERLVAQKAPGLSQYLMMRHSYADYANGDLKSFVLSSYKDVKTEITNLYHKIVEVAEEHVKTAIPVKMSGVVVQATSLAHYFLSFARALERDYSKCDSLMKTADFSPYGAFQGAGTSFNINRDMVARHMGFSASEVNSHDAISDRSYVTDFLYMCSAVHNNLSRIASDIIEWCAPGNEYIKMQNILARNSSLQYGEQDVSTLELVRAQAALSSGRLNSAMSILSNNKSSGYSADFELLPEFVFNAARHLTASLKVCSIAVASIDVDRSKTKEMSTYSYALSNDLYEWLVENTSNTPDECAEITCKIIRFAQDNSKKLSLIELDQMQAICPEINKDVYSALVASRSIIAKRSFGGANPVQVRKAIRHAKKKLKVQEK